MSIERYLRLIAGFFVMASVAMGYWVHPNWYLFTAFVGLNLFQSAFTNWCPMITFLRKLGVRSQEGPEKVRAWRALDGERESCRARIVIHVAV